MLLSVFRVIDVDTKREVCTMNRKEMVVKLSEYLGVKQKYLGPPSFAYEIRTEEVMYHIDRYGEITNAQGVVMTFEEIVNPQEVSEETVVAVETTREQEDTPFVDGIELTLPLEGHTGISLQNIVNMLSSKQHLIMKAFLTDTLFVGEDFAKELNEEQIDTVEAFKIAVDKQGTHRCPGLAFDLGEQTLTFKLTDTPLTPERINAFKDLGALISSYAKQLKRTSFKQSQDENPKYALRTWLIRIGMNGPEYKETRKILLKNLQGSGAYRTVDIQEAEEGVMPS